MAEKIVEYLLILSIGTIGVGIAFYFTAFKGEKWYPGMDFSCLNRWLSEKESLRIAYLGMILLLLTFVLIIVFTKLGIMSKPT